MKIELTVINKSGLHAKPASLIVETASRFKNTKINIIKNSSTINAKSILGILSLEANQGTSLVFEANGREENEALQALKNLFDLHFGELPGGKP
ncbi:MAG: hypothetical protein A2096_02725 [Spirochaetes bacterium GWF1_41_5]|nr:MAG: hypothetical protein A2096_02725 [Spirochaetes bacterium GWF1_41_5]HBE01112.1 phosphocarrier protein HPr [Spirochaetia bacterium]